MQESDLQKEWNSINGFHNFRTMRDKGYPECFLGAKFLIKTVGYACYKDMGDYYLIGNNYVHPDFRKQGVFNELFELRTILLNKPKIGIILPLEETNIANLFGYLAVRGYDEIRNYEDVSDVMSKEDYNQINQYLLVRG